VSLKQLLHRIGRRMAELRVAKKRTQEDVAAALDVSPRYVQRLESGSENVSVGTMYKIAQVLGADVTDFFAKPDAAQPSRVPRRKATAKKRSSRIADPRR
jgi:transcriptional regulator with XRE-family HTH domain